MSGCLVFQNTCKFPLDWNMVNIATCFNISPEYGFGTEMLRDRITLKKLDRMVFTIWRVTGNVTRIFKGNHDFFVNNITSSQVEL